jgi:hypothetical protein
VWQRARKQWTKDESTVKLFSFTVIIEGLAVEDQQKGSSLAWKTG